MRARSETDVQELVGGGSAVHVHVGVTFNAHLPLDKLVSQIKAKDTISMFSRFQEH